MSFPDHSSLGEKVRELRKQHHLTQSQLADLAGVSVPSIIRLEGGKATIRLDVLVKALAVIGCELAIQPITSKQGAS